VLPFEGELRTVDAYEELVLVSHRSRYLVARAEMQD